MHFVCFILVTIAATVSAQGNIRDYRVDPYYDQSPKPYSFSYSAPLDDGVGQSSRSETADGSGRVQGSYSLNNDEGHYRVVDYVADENGFRASIRTNEPGTESKNPADVTIESAAGPYPYAPIARPVLNTLIEPVAPVAEPVVIPDPIAPIRRPVYRRPATYAARRPVLRAPGRLAYGLA
ncbi:adult-specific rigid cuticular protein 15.5 [Parasteatoda tepidariorum]|uniref:adult-specific rigid cuticular protein 15.5 n=1 Tax=Parasteatoda tepidariorum TaxID=114398 RepID=UPI001C724D30|nr:adult-specific rigid cuticular protein 15.5 [Parasteatoda tepidariorum]